MALLAARSRNRLLWSGLLQKSYPGSQRIQERNAAVPSSQFPEYSVIFDFDKIRAAGRFNRTKMQMTVLAAAGSPIVFCAQHFGIVTPGSASTFAFIGCAITVFLHSVGLLFNNTIGYIYLKDDGESVKISHVGYWGQRIDVDTTIDRICHINDLPSHKFSQPWYMPVRLVDSRKKYKMYLKSGSVLDSKIFATMFGKEV